MVGSEKVHISKYANQVVAVDGYAWLHRGVHSCTWELGIGIASDKYLIWCMERVALLLRYGVRPLLVFDGGPLPAKAEQESIRKSRREEARSRALQCARENRHEEARKWFAKSIDVTPEMAARLIDACVSRWGRERVDFVVAPYEADAQLALECREGRVAAVVSEDSDNLAYGTPRVLFKLEVDGMADEIVVGDLFAPDRTLATCAAGGEEIDVRGWTEAMFATMCALAGCDYVNSVRGVGIKIAHRFVARYREKKRIFRALRFEYGSAVPPNYERDVEKALLTFCHQIVFCRRRKSTIHLAPVPQCSEINDLAFLGRLLPDEIALGIADARLEPVTHQTLVRIAPQSSTVRIPLTAKMSTHNTQEKITRFFRKSPNHGPASPLDGGAQSPSTNVHPRRTGDSQKASCHESKNPRDAELRRGAKRPAQLVENYSRENVTSTEASLDSIRRSTYFPKKQPAFKPFKIPSKIVPIADKENLVESRKKCLRKFAFCGRGGSEQSPPVKEIALAVLAQRNDNYKTAPPSPDKIVVEDAPRRLGGTPFARFALESNAL